MKRRSRMVEIEEQQGKPMSDILIEMYRHFNSQKEIADKLGISQPALSLWLVRLGLKEKTVLVPRDEGLIVMPSEAATEAIAYPREMEVVVS